MDTCANGDYTITLLRTAKGKMIEIHHNVMTPRPYDRKYQLTGTEGFANKYPIEGFAFVPENIDTDEVPDHEDLSSHSFVPEAARKALMEKYMHPIHKEVGEIAKKVGGHGGMDFVMDYRLVYCLLNGLPLDMDVYDAASGPASVSSEQSPCSTATCPSRCPTSPAVTGTRQTASTSPTRIIRLSDRQQPPSVDSATGAVLLPNRSWRRIWFQRYFVGR